MLRIQGYIILYGRWDAAAHLCFLSNSRLICDGDRSRQHRVRAGAPAPGWQRTYDAISFSTEYSMIAVVAIAMASASISSDMSTVFTCALKAAIVESLHHACGEATAMLGVF